MRFNVILNVLWDVTAEKQRCFLLIQFLTWCLFIFLQSPLQIIAIFSYGSAEDKTIISKKKKSDIFGPLCMQPHPLLSCPPLICSREKRGNLHKSRINREVRGLLGVVSLMAQCDTLGLPIDFDSIRYWSHASHHSIDQVLMRTHFYHNFFQTTPFNLILSFTHIQLHRHFSHLPWFLLINMMHCFKSDRYIISNKAFRHKGTLILTNDVWE